jgi:hypothetical protein
MLMSGVLRGDRTELVDYDASDRYFEPGLASKVASTIVAVANPLARTGSNVIRGVGLGLMAAGAVEGLRQRR